MPCAISGKIFGFAKKKECDGCRTLVTPVELFEKWNDSENKHGKDDQRENPCAVKPHEVRHLKPLAGIDLLHVVIPSPAAFVRAEKNKTQGS